MQPSSIFTFIPIFYLYIYILFYISSQIYPSKVPKYLHFSTETHIKRIHINNIKGQKIITILLKKILSI